MHRGISSRALSDFKSWASCACVTIRPRRHRHPHRTQSPRRLPRTAQAWRRITQPQMHPLINSGHAHTCTLQRRALRSCRAATQGGPLALPSHVPAGPAPYARQPLVWGAGEGTGCASAEEPARQLYNPPTPPRRRPTAIATANLVGRSWPRRALTPMRRARSCLCYPPARPQRQQALGPPQQHSAAAVCVRGRCGPAWKPHTLRAHHYHSARDPRGTGPGSYRLLGTYVLCWLVRD